MTGCFHPNMKI